MAEFHCTFKLNINISQFCLLKMQESSTLKCFTFTSKCTKMRLMAPAGGAYSAPPELLAGLQGEGREEGGRGREGKGEEGKGKDPQRLKCVDAPVEAALSTGRVSFLLPHQ